MTPEQRDRFDALLRDVLDELPASIHELLEETPLIVEDHPSPQLLRELDMDEQTDSLCGLHTGVPLTERSVERPPELPEVIHVFREGVIEQAGGWRTRLDPDGHVHGGDDAIRREIRITVLHEIGHHFGLDENDLEEMGYG